MFKVSSICYSMSKSVKTVSIIGSGLMGSGIAQVTAQAGYNVNIVDVSNDVLDKSIKSIEKNVARVAKKKFNDKELEANTFISSTMERIKTLIDPKEAAAKSDLIIEAIIENIDIKHKLFKDLDECAPNTCVFASNTSSLSVGEIAKATKRVDRFGGLHFFNPVPIMKLVEVISTADTSSVTTQILLDFASSLEGKTTVQCKDTPGFIVNRLLVPYLAEAIHMLERGDATASDIDTAMRLGAGYPMGPLTLADYVGLDTTKFILDGWHAKYPDIQTFKPPELLKKMVQDNKLGIKSGSGFYDYPAK